MKTLRLVVSVALAGGTGGALACGDSTGSGPRAASVTGIAGDSQIAPTGAQLTFPLTFVALGSSGEPVQGITATWSVAPQGAATFNPASSSSDVNGTITTNVTLGADSGIILIQAAVPGISPVVFHEHAVDPCVYLNPYTVGQTVNAALASTDCHRNLGGAIFYYDYYRLAPGSGQQSVRIAMNAASFDTYLDLWRIDGPYIGFDDDVIRAQITNSQLDIIFPGDTAYVIGANSYNPTTSGNYTLTVSTRPAAMNGCREVWVSGAVSFTDSIRASDCSDSGATPHYYDVARIIAFSGTQLTIAQHSSTLNPLLALYQLDDTLGRALVTSNDDSAATFTNAFISYSVTTTGVYDILIGTSSPGETGSYTLDLTAAAMFSPPVRAPAIGTRKWWGSPVLPRRAKAT